MKKTFTLLLLLCCSVGLLQAQSWYVYDGSAVPTDLDGWSASSNSPGPNMVEAIIDDPVIEGNKLFQYVHPDEFLADGVTKASKYYRLKFEDANVVTKLTVVLRSKGIQIDSLDKEMIMTLDVQIPFRESLELKIDDGTVGFDKADVNATAGVNLDEWHLYRFTMDEAGNVACYVDESITPALTATTAVSSSNSYIRFGDGGSARVAGYTDWLIIDTTGAYAPGAGAAIPEGLSIDFGPDEPELGLLVPSGDTIQNYIDAASDGDVLLLESGGIYQTETLTIPKSLTIKAVNGYTVLPKVYNNSTNGIKYEGGKGQEIVLKNIEFVSGGARYLNRLATGDSLAYLEMTGVVGHGFDRSIIRASDAGIFVDSVLIDDCYFYDLLGSNYRLFYFDKADCPVKYFKVVNSSFVNFSRTFLQLNSPDTKKTIIVENCNIHGRSDSREDDLFDIDGPEGSSFTLSNSIISSIQLGRIWDIKETVTDSVMNVYYFEVDSVTHLTDSTTWSYEAMLVEQDPMFSNGAVGALYLDAASPALTASTTGGVIGDPRWAVTPGVAELFSLTADAGILMPGFDAGTLDYTLEVPYGTASVEVDATAAFASATVTGTGAIDVSSGSGAATVVVTAGDGTTTQTYTVAITVALPSIDASLGSLSIDPDLLDPAFDPAVYDYTALVPVGTDTVFVFAEVNDETATLTITDTVDVSSGSGVATVVVTAQDGVTSNTYTVTITVDNTGIEPEEVNNIRMHYNSLNDQLMIFETGDVELVEIYSLTGSIISKEKFHQQESLEISTGSAPNGVYFVRMTLSDNQFWTGKFIKY